MSRHQNKQSYDTKGTHGVSIRLQSFYNVNYFQMGYFKDIILIYVSQTGMFDKHSTDLTGVIDKQSPN